MTHRLRVFTLAVVVSLLAAESFAAVPSPYNSMFPPCLVTCPLGDIPFNVTVRDLAYNPVPGADVLLDFSQCPGAYVCTSGGPDPYTWDPVTRFVRRQSNAVGQANFPLRIGGVCPSGSVRLYADGVFFASYALASPDQDGNGVVVSVIGADDPMFAAKLGTSDPTADFNCDGYVDDADEQIFFYHHSHGCDGYVDPTRRSSWGRLKAHYR